MMKIAYLAEWNIGHESGVLKKIIDQMNHWSTNGNQVKLFALSPTDCRWDGVGDIPVEMTRAEGIRDYIFQSPKLFEKVKVWKPDLIYLRFSIYFPAMRNLARSIPVICEINTHDLVEYWRNHSVFLNIYHNLTRDLILRQSSGFILVTRELEELFQQYSQPKQVISNGIDLSRYTEAVAPNNCRPRLVFIGTPNQPWHGIDKILWLAIHHLDWDFDLIGINPEHTDRRMLKNITLHGYLTQKEYEGIISSADIAIGSLGLYRNHMHEACPLKVREYLAYGIPTIIGYEDTDFPGAVPFLLKLPATENNIEENVGEIESFVQEWKGKRVPREKISHIDVLVKERRRLEFFQNMLN
jgi:glycosyltransferase involved in cell wall biosynthesis